jgi:hypothetical protein
MASKKHKKRKKDIKPKHKALNAKLAGFIILILIIMAGLFYYVKYMPQVSNCAADEALIEYHGALQGLYPELNENYARMKQDGDEEKWDEFSKEWMSKFRAARPEILDRRLTRKSEDRKQTLMTAQRSLLMLWNEYNKNIKEGFINEEHVAELKKTIEECLENFK